MELDERLRWIETRVTSSLKPRAEELKHLFTNEACRTAMFEFCNNEEVKNLYIYSATPPGGKLIASLTPPQTIREKAMFFIKSHTVGKLTRDNIIDEVAFVDCSNKPLNHMNALTRDVYLPLLSIEMGGSVSSDKLMDLLHRLVANMEVMEGSLKDQVFLPLPSIEVLSEAAAYSSRRPVVIHVLETTVISWIKLIKGTLKIDPEAEIAKKFGAKPCPLDEIEMWSDHLERITMINEQLCSHVALNIIMNLEDAHSTYAQSFHGVKRDIAKAETEANDNLQFLTTLLPWFEKLHYTTDSRDMVSLFAPLMHTMYLVWAYSRYYHDPKNFTRLLTMISNEVVARARHLVGENVLDSLLESYTSLKDALRVCAAFRGCYLDKKDKADDLNQKKLSEQTGTNVDSGGVVWHSKLYTDSITPKAGKLFDRSGNLTNSMNDLDSNIWVDSAWPPRNNPCFISLNNFMERCNDVLELVQTTRHFELLTIASEVGGAGEDNLDCLVREIHVKFNEAIRSFKQMAHDVLDADETQHFEKEFFAFRSITRELEFSLADVLRQSFKQCWDTRAKLRLLEVFEGISGRELVQANLKDIFTSMVYGLTQELLSIRTHFEHNKEDPPSHPHLPPVASKVLWLRGLKLHIQQPMARLGRVSPASLKGDDGWRLRDTYTDLLKDIEKCESETLNQWQNDIQTELRVKLKQPLLISEVESAEKPPILHVNFDPELLLLLREIHYLASSPFDVRLPDQVRVLLRSTDDGLLRSTAARLDTIVSRYNSVMASMEDFEKPLFEKKLARIDELLRQGLYEYSWKAVESADFVEHASYLVCDDVHFNLGVVQSNYREICNVAGSWSTSGQLDVFTPRNPSVTFPMEKLQDQHTEIYENHKHTIMVGGQRIHSLIQSTFEAVQISRASPSWQSYTQHVNEVVLRGLLDSTLVSLQSMLNQIVHSNIAQDNTAIPILTIRLELVGPQVLFNPTLDENTASISVQESVQSWLRDFLKRGEQIKPLNDAAKPYTETITEDEEVQRLVKQITDVVVQNSNECKGFLATFREYAFLWMQDVRRTFEEFLAGNIEAHPRKMNRSELIRSRASGHSEKSKKEKEKDTRSSSRTSAAASSLSTSGAMGLSEKTFLNPKKMTAMKGSREGQGPSLDDFDREIEIYQTARDEIIALQDWCDVGWMRVNMTPIKQVLGTYSSKWMFVYTKYLSDQVSTTLNDLDSFLKRIEPGIEAITGEERDIASFMRLMRVFNEVSTQQAEMDSKFVAMKRTITLLEKYGQKLPEMTEKFYAAAPQRWNNLKMKVNQAKQRLGPRIQAEARSVTQELKAFGDRCDALSREFAASEAFNRKCAIYTSFTLMDAFGKKLEAMESEAQDLIELQELFEKVVVNFSVLPQLRSDLECLRQVWTTYRAVQEQHSEWKRGRWQRINTRLMRKATEAQLDLVQALPADSIEWDVYQGMMDSILDIQACLPIIDDLSKSAMRPRHWKQLLRLAGGAVQISNEGLTRMTLGQLLDLGLHNHADEVRAIIQRATKDVAIESSLKTYEEVWLSKIFEMRPHTRMKGPASSAAAVTQENTGSEFGKDSEFEMHAGPRGMSSRVSVTSHGSGGFSVKDNKTARKTSIASATFSQSLINLTQDAGPICLLDKCEPIFEELEEHQVSLQSMLTGSAAGSFTDDILKWQKRLQTIEAVLSVWLDVQEKWVELEDVYTSLEFRIAMPHETNLFSAVNRDFRILMKATEKNPNVLQACSRTNIQTKLEKLNMNLQQCWKSLLNHLERRRLKFPRFFFLSHEDVLHVVCNGYDPGLVNPYLSKVVENLGCLDYEEFEAEGQTYFQITAAISNHGERLPLKQPVLCDGPVDTWLATFLTTLRQTITDQLNTIVGTPPSQQNGGPPDQPPGTSSSYTRIEQSFTLDNCTEVVLLAMQIELTKKVEKALQEVIGGNREAVKDVFGKLTTILDSVAVMLKGAQKETALKAAKSEEEGSETGAAEALEEVALKRALSRNTSATHRTVSAASRDIDGRSDISVSSAKPEKQGTEQGTVELIDMDSTRKSSTLVLFPHQIQKISNLIALLSQKRDLLRDLVERIDSGEQIKAASDWFDWRAHSRYRWDDEEKSCKVEILDLPFDYGFEYQGTCTRLALSPFTDRCIMGLAKALKSNMVGVCSGTADCDKTETVNELSKILGYPLYSFNSSRELNRSMLVDICRGLASSGSWVCFNNITAITPPVLSVFTQLLQIILDGLRANKTSIFIQEDEVPLVSNAACFATLTNTTMSDSSPTQYLPNVGYFSSFNSSISQLPKNLLSLFRPVALMGPDWAVILEVWLLSEGFSQGPSLASKIVALRDLCMKLIPSASKPLPIGMSRCIHKSTGWGLVSLKRMVENARNQLFKCQEECLVTRKAEGTSPRGEEDSTLRGEGDGAPPSPTDAVAAVNAPEPEGSQTSEQQQENLRLEETAIVLSLRDTFMPGLTGGDAVMFATLLADLFPHVQVPMIFDSYGVVDGKMALNDPVSNLDEIPVTSRSRQQTPIDEENALDNITDAIRVATGKLGLQPGISFQSRVFQLAELVSAHRVVCVVGPSGCGKTECIKTLAAAHREMGQQVKTDTVCTGAMDSEELLGYVDQNTREWKDGLLAVLLRRQCRQLCLQEMGQNSAAGKTLMKWLHLDGMIDSLQMEIFGSVIQNSGTIVLGNNERIKVPEALLILWELESLENLSPAVLSSVGMLTLNSSDVSWPLLVERWLTHRPEREVEVLRELCDRYIDPTLDYLASKTSVPPQTGAPAGQNKSTQLRHVVSVNEMGMVNTLLTIVEAIIANYQDLMPSEFENYFCYAAMWAFGGTLEEKHRPYFSQWWREQWGAFVSLPGDEMVWNYFVNPETHEFQSWRDSVPPYAQTAAEGIPNEAYVHTVHNERISHLVGLLADAGKPVLLVGEEGGGKTSILRHRLKQHGGDIGEVLSMTVYCNKFTSGRSLWREMSNCLEWKHAHTYVPKGNKRLTCLVDDLNLSKATELGTQSSCELVRQHIDHGGVFDPETHKWREIRDVSYLSSYNPYTPPTTAKLSNRLLRHFALFSVSFPSISELHYIYTQQLEKHFLLNVHQPQSSGADSSSTGTGESREEQAGTGYQDRAMRELLNSITFVTLELQDHLRTMYLATAQRCHYMFTMTDLTMIFRNICLTLRPGCSHRELLLLWKHEVDWVYSRRLIDAVDKERLQQAFLVAAKKRFTNEEQLSVVSGPTPFFTNLIDLEESAGEVMGAGASEVNDDDVHLSYRHVTDMEKVRAVLEHGIEEYNKDFPRLKITLHDGVMEVICRLVRIVQCPHECGHAMIVSEGSPGLATKLAQLAAHLCDYAVFRINPSSVSNANKYTLESFKADLVQAYTRAGVKGEHLLLLLPESDMIEEDFLVYVSEFLVSCSISHLFSEEEQTSVINAVRTEVTQAGLTYTRDVAWDFFLKTVRENLRVVMTCTSLGDAFQKRCRSLPALTNTVSIMLLQHWSKEALVSHASHHLKDVSMFSAVEKENLAHLMSSMHLALRHRDDSSCESGTHGHLTNTTFEIFVEKFINLVKKRQEFLLREYEHVEAALKTIERGTMLAEQLKKQLEHEKTVLAQKKEGNCQLLMQIGQDRAIAEEQVRLVRRQEERIQKLKKALPEYQIAHERAVFKAAAVVSDTKRVLKFLDAQGLTELRAMQKPDSEIEDLLAALIIIVKSPTSDLTWNKGAKRLMANLDRFREELSMFDEIELPPSTLQVVEPYLKKPHFSGDYLERKTNNSAVGSLVLWVRGVVRYHRMMQSKVKPLHAKVAETSSAEESAVGKMTAMDDKLRGLEERLKSLSLAYEEASIDKCRQYELTQTLDAQLTQAAYFEEVLASGRQKWLIILDAIKSRREAIAGGVAIAAAFSSYLGPYNFSFRRDMMTIHWPACLEERGVPLVLDASAPYPDARLFKTDGLSKTESDLDKQADGIPLAEPRGERDPGDGAVEQEGPRGQGDGVMSDGETANVPAIDENSNYPTRAVSTKPEPDDQKSHHEMMDKTLVEYDAFSLAISKLLLGDGPVRKLLTKGMGLRKIENAVLAKSSWQRVPLLMDPNNKSLELIRLLEEGSQMLELDLGESDQSTVMKIEKAITSGTVLVLYNIDTRIDSLFMPLIHHINTAVSDEVEKEAQVVKFGNRRVTCHPNFRLYLVSRSSDPVFSTEVASITTLINFELCEFGLEEELALEAFARVRPGLYVEARKSLLAVVELLKLLEDVDSKLMKRIMTKEGTDIWDETELIADLVQCRTEITRRLLKAMENLEVLSRLRREFRGLAKRGVVLFNLMKGLSRVQHEYRFSLDYFMSLFKSAVGKDFIPPKGERLEYDEDAGGGRRETHPQHTSVEIKVVDEEGTTTAAVNADHKPRGTSSSARVELRKRTSVVLPPEVQLPSPGVDYTGLSDEDSQEIQAALTKAFYGNVSRSIFDRHRLLFASLVYLISRTGKREQSEITQQELEILLDKPRQTSVSLSDFDPTLIQPSWVPHSVWASVLAVSTLKGPLDSVCTHVASNSSVWREWCDKETPETQASPLDEKDDSPSLTPLQKLLQIRCFRPDRFEPAMRSAVKDTLSSLVETDPPSIKSILSGIIPSIPIFILVPDHGSISTPYAIKPVDGILDLAKSLQVTCRHLSVGHGQEEMIDVGLATAIRTDSWLIIDNLHLASRHWLDQLYNRLLRLHLQAETARSPSQWRIFLVSEPCAHLPVVLLLFSHQLAWDVVHRQHKYQYLDAGDLDLRDTIAQTLQSIPLSYWEKARDQSPAVRTSLFSLCVIHSVLLLRQQCGTRALSGYYPFDLGDLLSGFDLVIGKAFSQDNSGTVKFDGTAIAQTIYSGKVADKWDQRCTGTIADMVLKSAGSSITLGHLSIPVPPVNLDPSEYSQWFQEKTAEGSWAEETTGALCLDSSVTRERREASASQFIANLRSLLLTCLEPKTKSLLAAPGAAELKSSVPSLNTLRQAMDLCLDKLPTLLKIEMEEPQSLQRLIPRVLSQLRALSVYSETSSISTAEEKLSESLGYVLQKECEWFNCQLYHVRHDLQTLEQCVLAGSAAIPHSLDRVVSALQRDQVPLSWLHPNEHPSPHFLSSWLDDFHRRHKQLSEWLLQGVVPRPSEEPVLGRGRLKSVWLGGLANPGAVVTSLRHEKAAISGCSIHEVSLRCSIAKKYGSRDSGDEDDGIVVSGLYLEGATYDTNSERLKPQTSSAIFPLPDMHLRAVTESEVQSDSQGEGDGDSALPWYNCPIYINRARQTCAFSLPLQSSSEPEQLTLAGVAVVLDPGDVSGSWKLVPRPL